MKNFEKLIWRDAITLVEFSTTRCNACERARAETARFKQRMGGRVDLYRLDIEDADLRPVLERYNIRSAPAVLFFRDGRELNRIVGPITYATLLAVLDRIEAAEHVQ